MKKLLLIILILCIQFSNAQVGIGTSSPNESAQLEVLSSEKGLLIPRLQLSSTTDVTAIKNGNVESLLIYNTVNTSDVTKGFYYWGGTKWRKIVTESIVKDLISAGGLNGLSAFEVWQSQPGNANKTINEYFIFIKGADGVTGADGSQGVQGVQGVTGINGLQGVQGIQGLSGVDGSSVQIIGSVPNVAALPSLGNTIGDGWITEDDGHLHVWGGTSWTDVGEVKGPKGDVGLQGVQGVTGIQGVQGIQGLSGVDGSSVQIKGSVVNVAALPSSGNTIGDGQITEDDGHLHVWGGTSWTDVGEVKGPKGDVGLQGVQGVLGATGIQGATGADGADGAKGDTGDAGVDALTTLTNGKVYVGNGSNDAAEVSISGDATIANTGALTIANDAVTTVKIADGAITKTKLILSTIPADNGKVLAIKSDGTGLEWKVSSTGGVLYTEDFMEDNSTPKAHSLAMSVLGTTANNFKVSLNGSVISPSNIAYDSSNGTNGSIKITGIPVYNYDVVTVAYITNN
jgi:hypothetical protein